MHGFDPNTLKLTVRNTGIRQKIVYLGFLISLIPVQVNVVTCPLGISQWGKQSRYLKYSSVIFKSLIVMMNKAKDDIPGAILHWQPFDRSTEVK